jgi:hypothetical protein
MLGLYEPLSYSPEQIVTKHHCCRQGHFDDIKYVVILVGSLVCGRIPQPLWCTVCYTDVQRTSRTENAARLMFAKTHPIDILCNVAFAA